jgi:hypothetical protein
MHNTEAAKITILRTKGPVDNRHLLNQLRAERLQRAEVALAVSLRALILLHIINQHLQPTVYSSVVEVEPKPPNLKRFPSTFMLPRVDAGV